MKHTMRHLNTLIEALESTRFSVIDPRNKREVEKVESLNEHLDYIINQIKTIYGANETLGGKLSRRVRKAILIYLIDQGEIKREQGEGWFEWMGKSLTRYHLRIIWEDKHKIRNLGKVAIEEVKVALRIQ